MIKMKNNIEKLQNEINELKENQLNLFHKKFDYMKHEYKSKIQYDLKFAALFGNGIQIYI